MWEERELIWGVRPDGFSLHRDHAALEEYVGTYWAGMPETEPPEYSVPDGTPYLVGVNDRLASQLLEVAGLRFYDYVCPGSGGVDGWMPINLDLPNSELDRHEAPE